MKVTFQTYAHKRMFNLGIETWFPAYRTWKRFQIQLLIGPYAFEITFGSRKLYAEETALLNNY